MPRKWKGGRKEAQKRYRAKHAERLQKEKRAHYEANKEIYQQHSRRYREKNKEQIKTKGREYQRLKRVSMRRELIDAYGGECACCGESEPLFLDLDHINNDGNAHRKRGARSLALLYEIKREGWPKDKYRLLCCNCNQGRSRNGGTCPHKQHEKDRS